MLTLCKSLSKNQNIIANIYLKYKIKVDNYLFTAIIAFLLIFIESIYG